MKDIMSMRYVPTKQQLRARCTTISAWQLPKQRSALAPEHVWTNEDMDPVKPENQTWSIWTWMAYWATDTLNLGTWETASSILALGLSWREAIPAVSPRLGSPAPFTAKNDCRLWWEPRVWLSP
jgi:NCS1 family nucleobase:cation symporter-1